MPLLLFLLFLQYLPSQYILTHINIVDVETGQITKDQNVFIIGNKIGPITPLRAADAQARIYDCTGKYLIPGLWDMHIHDGGDDSSNRNEYVPLFLANGVTGIRDMWGEPEMLQLKREIDAGHFVGPRMVIGSPIVEGDKPFWRGSLKATTENRGRQLVDSLQQIGYDFIKIYSLIRDSVYFAIADECKKKNIPLEGHLPIEVRLEQAIDAGQRSFEHNFGINIYLTGKEDEKLQWAAKYLDTLHHPGNGSFMIHGEPLTVTEKDFNIQQKVLEKIIQNRVAIVPTLTITYGYSTPSDIMAKRTKGLNYLSAGFVDYWMKKTPEFPPELTHTFGAAAKFLANKGVLILAGTDVNNPFCVPGFGLQQELLNLREAGLTNLQVLQAATLNPAKFLYRENDLGTVKTGKLADLLVLDANPLADIANTQKINAVIVNGKYLSKDDIAQMLATQRKR
jgi:hypothetical protein